jgi:hypothetical protein
LRKEEASEVEGQLKNGGKNMTAGLMIALGQIASFAVMHVYETYVKDKKQSGEWVSEKNGKEAHDMAVKLTRRMTDDMVKREELKKRPTNKEIKAAVNSKVAEITSVVKAATPTEMYSCIKTACERVEKEYIEPLKTKGPGSYDDAERQVAYKKCFEHAEELLKYHNFKINKEIIGTYIMAIGKPDDVKRP